MQTSDISRFGDAAFLQTGPSVRSFFLRFDPSDETVTQFVGHGSFGAVYRCPYASPGLLLRASHLGPERWQELEPDCEVAVKWFHVFANPQSESFTPPRAESISAF